MELFTLSEFQTKMEEQHENVHSPSMTKKKLQEKYREEINFVSRNRKSDTIILSNISSTLTEAWYNERKVSKADEAECIIKTAAKLIKMPSKITHETDFYPTVDDIKNTDNEFVPLALQTFIKELVKSPVKQNYLSQAIFAASRPRTVMPLLFGLAVTADNRMSSKWLNNVLYKCGFAVSYDEYVKFGCH